METSAGLEPEAVRALSESNTNHLTHRQTTKEDLKELENINQVGQANDTGRRKARTFDDPGPLKHSGLERILARLR